MPMFAAPSSETHTQNRSRSPSQALPKRRPRNFPVSSLQPLIIQRKASCTCGGGCPRCQAKSHGIRISQPNDPAEVEADRIADEIMCMPESGLEEGNTRTVDRRIVSSQPMIQRQEAESESDEERSEAMSLDSDFDLRLDWFEMTRPFYARGAESLLFFDEGMYDSIGHVWTNNYRFFVNVGLGESLSADAANFFTPFTIDSALKHDYATASELFERNADVTSILISPTLFSFDIHNIPGTLRVPVLNMFGLGQPNPYAPPGGDR